MESKSLTNKFFVIRTATFGTGLLVLSSILLNFIYGNIGSLNKTLSMGPRVWLFLMLWVTTWWCMKKAFVDMTSKSLALERWGDSLSKGGLWGSINASITFVILFVSILLKGSASFWDFLATLLPSLFVILFGIPIAAIVGSLVGFLGAIIIKFLVEVANLQELSVRNPSVE